MGLGGSELIYFFGETIVFKKRIFHQNQKFKWEIENSIFSCFYKLCSQSDPVLKWLQLLKQ